MRVVSVPTFLGKLLSENDFAMCTMFMLISYLSRIIQRRLSQLTKLLKYLGGLNIF